MSFVTLDPNALIGNSGISVVGTGSVLTALSDASDATYIIGTANNGYARLNLGTTTIGSQRIRSTQVTVRDAHDSSGGGPETGIAFLYDTKGPGRSAQMDLNRTATSVAAQTGGQDTYGGPNGQAWTQTLLDRLAIQVQLFGTSDWLRVHKLQAIIELTTQPVTSAVTPTGYTTTTRPNVAWTFTSAEGWIQSRYRILVYTAAQYGASGFVAGTSTATWDSDNLFGDATDLDLTVDLVSGTTYKFYVKTAIDWPGPEGDLWWSTYVASAAFTVAVVPPVTPTLTATADTALPGYRMLLTATAPINLLTAEQAGLEGGTTTGWASLTNATLSNSTTTAAEGTHSLQMASVASGTMSAETSARVAVSPNTVYSATAASRPAVTARTQSTGIRWYDSAGVLIGATVFGSGATNASGSYTTTTVTATSPNTAYTAAVVLQIASTGGAAETVRWDQIGIQAGSVATWTTGGTQSTATVAVQRLLKVTSSRAAPGNWAHPQLSSGSGLTRDTSGFTPRGTSRIESRVLDTAHPAGTAVAGARMIVWHPLVGASNLLDVGLPIGTTDDDAPPYILPAVPGRAMTVSMYLRGSSAVNARLQVIAVDATNASTNTVLGSTVALSTASWTRYTATITPNTGACYARIAVELTASSSDLDVYVTGVQAELGSSATAFVPGTGQEVPAWETVRELDSTAPVSPGETYRVYDHEVPPGDPVLYRARTAVDTLASGYTAVLAMLMDPPSRSLLKDPYEPENAMTVNVGTDYGETQSADAAIYRPIGRDQTALGTADPVQVRDWLGGQDASLNLVTKSALELYQLRNLLASATPLLLQYAAGGQSYLLVAEDRSMSWLTPGASRVQVKTIQCARPV